MNIYDISVTKMNGNTLQLDEYKGKVLLIVNTASKCGFTPQFEGLESLYKQYKNKGLVVLGFPCNQFMKQDPGSNEEILEFCQLNYGVSFPMFQKINVKGKEQHPLYEYLVNTAEERKGKAIKWNFEKFLVDREGTIINRFGSQVKPGKIEADILRLL